MRIHEDLEGRANQLMDFSLDELKSYSQQKDIPLIEALHIGLREFAAFVILKKSGIHWETPPVNGENDRSFPLGGNKENRVHKDAPLLAEQWAEVLEYFPLVQALAGEKIRQLPLHMRFDDLISAGTIGLIEAVRKYDSERECSFESYAKKSIRWRMLDYLRSEDLISRDRRRLLHEVDEGRRGLQLLGDYSPSLEKIAEHIKADPGKVLGNERSSKIKVVSLDENLGGEEDFPLRDTVSYTSFENPYAFLAKDSLRYLVLASLWGTRKIGGGKHTTVLYLHAYEYLSYKDIGNLLGFTESRSCQTYHEGLKFLKPRLQELL